MTQKRLKKVLICDDEPLIREAVAYAVKKTGNQHVMAENGNEAFDKVQAENPDLIMLDVGMPGMSGFDVCEKVRSLPDGDKYSIIILTAFGQASDQEKALKCGADKYICKPFSPRQLVSEITEILADNT